MLEASAAWIDSQRIGWLVDIDLGKWSGQSVRQMAEEAECLDFYNYVYTPFSACAHSMWHHVARYNLTECANPLHRHHRRPISAELDLDISYLTLAAKYWNNTLSTFDKAVDLSLQERSSYESLIAAIDPSSNKAPG